MSLPRPTLRPFLVLVPALVALAALLALTDSGAATALPSPRPNVPLRGFPQIGPKGVSRTMSEIMLEEASHAGEPPAPPDLMNEHEYPDRSGLPLNPLSRRVASIPEMPVDQMLRVTTGPYAPFSPQTVGVNFTATTLSSTNSYPPDCDGAVGPTQYIVAVNGRIVSFNKTTGTADGVMNSSTNTFFSSVRASSGTSDPMCRYDRLSNRWFLSIINVSTPNRWLLAVSDAASNGVISGTTVWTYYYFIPATVSPTISNGSTCLSDYPSLGIDANALYTGVSEFCGSGQPFQQTDVFVIRKSSVLSGGPIVVTAFRALMSASGNYVGPFSARGVDNYDPTSNEGYFIGTDGASWGTLWLNRVASPGGTPTLSSNIEIVQPATNGARPVPHPGNTGGYWGRLDPLDDRYFSAHIRNQQLWTAHNIGVDNTGVSEGTYLGDTRVASRWYHLDVPVGSGTPTIVEMGTVFTPSASNDSLQKNYFIPSIMVSGQGHVAMGFSTAGQNDYANCATVGRLASDPAGTMQTPTALTTNTNTYNPSADPGGVSAGRPRRWGDYSITSLDPLDDMSMWTVQEFCNANNSYGVRVARLIAPPPATPSAMADAQVGHASVSVTLTGTSASGSGFYDPGANLASPARAFNHLGAAVTNGGATGTPPTVVSATYVNPTTLTVVLNTSAATANLPGEKYNITVTNPDGQTAAGAVVHVTAGSFTITASAGAGGTISPSGAVTVPAGGSQAFTIAADTCYAIADVLVDGVSQGAVPGYTFTNVQAGHTIAASFVLRTYAIAASAGAGGTISPSGDVVVNCGADQVFSITPDAADHVLEVLVDGVPVGADTSYTFHTVKAPHTIAASFSVNTFSLSATATGRGGVTKVPDQAAYAYGSTVQLTPVPELGWRFTGWSGDTTTTGDPLALFMIRNWAVIAAFGDTTPPVVHVTYPMGGENLNLGTPVILTWTATDNEAVAQVDLFLSRVGVGGPYDTLATAVPNDGSYPWTVSGPATATAFFKVAALDSAGNGAFALSDSAFTIYDATAVEGGHVTEFALSSVGPNPTHGRCRVVFAVPRSAPVRVSVLDIQGREVAVLADGEQPAGRHEVAWSDAAGRVRPGLYFVRMTAPGHTFLRRIVVIR